MHVDYVKNGPLLRNLGNDEVIHVDYVKHGPVLRNLGDDEVIHVDYGRHGPVVRNFGDGGIIHVRETWSDREKLRGGQFNTRGFTRTIVRS